MVVAYDTATVAVGEWLVQQRCYNGILPDFILKSIVSDDSCNKENELKIEAYIRGCVNVKLSMRANEAKADFEGIAGYA